MAANKQGPKWQDFYPLVLVAGYRHQPRQEEHSISKLAWG